MINFVLGHAYHDLIHVLMIFAGGGWYKGWSEDYLVPTNGICEWALFSSGAICVS